MSGSLSSPANCAASPVESLETASTAPAGGPVLSSAGSAHGVCPLATGLLRPVGRPTSNYSLAACALGGLSLVLLLVFPGALLGIQLFSTGEEIVAYAVLGTLLGLLFLVSLAAISTSLLALWKLRRARGAETGYAWATAGLFMAAVPQAVAALLLVYVGSSLMSDGNGPVQNSGVGMTSISTFDPVTGTYFTEQIGVDFDFSLNPNRASQATLRTVPTVPVGSNAVPLPSRAPTSPGEVPPRMTGQQPSRAESDVVTASLSESVNEPVKAEATVELPPEPVPAVVDAAGASGENNGSSDRDWGAVFRCLPLIVEPTMATRGNQYYESSR